MEYLLVLFYSRRFALNPFSLLAFAAVKMYRSRKQYSEFSNIIETIAFMENVWIFWSIHDISNLTQHTRARMEEKVPFHANDGRLNWLQEEFPSYLDTWKRNAGPKQSLTNETFKALVLTCNQPLDASASCWKTALN